MDVLRYPRVIVDANKLREMYLAGKTENQISKELGIARASVRSRCLKLGLVPRTLSEAQLVRNSLRTPEQRAAGARAAHDAARGRKATFLELCQRAMTISTMPKALTAIERMLYEPLQSTNLTIEREHACGPYNIDFAVDGSVAVECFGGGWHATGRAAARFQKRVRYLIDAAWHVVVVWIDRRYNSDLTIRGAIEYAVSLSQETRLRPAMLRQYRMIWCYGKRVVVTGDANSQEFPLIPSAHMSRYATTSDNTISY